MTARLLTVALLLLPAPALACASCIASAYGDRTFNWAFLGLLLMPFLVGGVIAAMFALRWAEARHRAAAAGDLLGAPGSPNKETT